MRTFHAMQSEHVRLSMPMPKRLRRARSLWDAGLAHLVEKKLEELGWERFRVVRYEYCDENGFGIGAEILLEPGDVL